MNPLKFEYKELLYIVSIFIIATNIAIFLNISLLRQILGFLFLTILPGFLIIQILKLNGVGHTEKFLLLVGLSVSFLMFAGLLINWVCLFFDYSTPLSTNPMITSFSVILLILALLAYVRNRGATFAKLSDFRLNTNEKALLLLPAFFPALSIFGMHLMNTKGNNAMLIILLFLIAVYIIFIALIHEQVPEKIYSPIIFSLGISLLLMWALRSNHIVFMTDTDQEYYFFWLTATIQHWQMFDPCTVNSCLSISLLPTIYHCFLNIDQEILFRILYPLLFSTLPLVVYSISKRHVGGFYAFMGTICFISFYKFFTTNARVNTALLFFALAMLVLHHDKLNQSSKKLLFIIFAASCIVSHYSTSYIFLFILLLSWIGILVFRTAFHGLNKLKGEAITLSKPMLTCALALLYFTLLFVWYSQVTDIPFRAGVGFINVTLANLHNFFLMEARSDVGAIALGLQSTRYPGIAETIERVSSLLIVVLIVAGVLDTARRFTFTNGRVATLVPSSDSELSKPLPEKMEKEYFVFTLAAFIILVFSVVAPFVSRGYDLFRIYLQALVLLSVYLPVGAVVISKRIKFRSSWLLLVIILIPYFLCTTGAMYQVFNIPRSVTLNNEGYQYDDLFIHDQEHYAALWLGEYAGRKEVVKVYTDYLGRFRVITQGHITPRHVDNRLLLKHNVNLKGYIYLRYYNVVNGKILDTSYQEHDINKYQDKLSGKDKIYTNEGAEVRR